jgi:curved DNA-binding protein CbpA
VKRLADQTLYEILDVREDAPGAEIAAACERALELYGPGSLATYTLMTPDEAALLTRRIEEARATLLDPGARARYDELLQHGPGEARAAAAGANGADSPFPLLPPVIPAVQPSAAAPSPAEAAPAAGKIEAHPAIRLTAASEKAAPAKPILLEREVPAPAEPSAAVPAMPHAPPVAEPAPAVPPEGSAWTGDVLRQVREARGVTVQQIAERTKVTRHHIENIESERFGALPAPVYLRGILLSIARELRLDGQKVARAYLDRAAAALADKSR